MTIVAAWIRALTGVGPSIASGSQVCSGICADFATAPPSRPSATRSTVVCERCDAVANDSEKPSELPCAISTNSASAIVASPNAFITNAFFAAATADGFSCQKPISRYDERPTSPQPTSSSSRLPPSTSSSIEKTKNDMYAK